MFVNNMLFSSTTPMDPLIFELIEREFLSHCSQFLFRVLRKLYDRQFETIRVVETRTGKVRDFLLAITRFSDMPPQEDQFKQLIDPFLSIICPSLQSVGNYDAVQVTFVVGPDPQYGTSSYVILYWSPCRTKWGAMLLWTATD